MSHAGSNIHAPNENIFIDDYITSIKGIALLMEEYARRGAVSAGTSSAGA